MYRFLALLLLCTLGLAALAANVTVVINGKTIVVPVIVQNGKKFIDLAALVRGLGADATFNAATGKLVIGSGGGSAGTSQLPGDAGELGKVYSMRKGDPLFFSLVRAEFTVGPVLVGERLFTARADEKLLVLHFTVQNPNKADRRVRWDSLRLMAVDALEVNHRVDAQWGDEQTKQDVNLLLKPAQKLAMYTVVTLPAKGEVPKLMVQSNVDNDGPVLRYDLRGKVTPLPATFADPADPTGATAREQIPAETGTAYPLSQFNVTVEKFEYVTTALETRAPNAGERFLVATLAVTANTPRPELLRGDSFRLALTSTDGELLRYEGMLLASAGRRFQGTVKQGEDTRVRLYFTIPKDATPKTLTIRREDAGRAFVYDVPAR